MKQTHGACFIFFLAMTRIGFLVLWMPVLCGNGWMEEEEDEEESWGVVKWIPGRCWEAESR